MLLNSNNMCVILKYINVNSVCKPMQDQFYTARATYRWTDKINGQKK
jgi:hypothetical protein